MNRCAGFVFICFGAGAPLFSHFRKGFKVVVSLHGMVFLLITWKAVVLDEYNYASRIGLQRR